MGTRADWEHVKTKTPNSKDGHKVGRGKGAHTEQDNTALRVQGAHKKPLQKDMNLNVWYAWWARRGIHFRSPWEEQGVLDSPLAGHCQKHPPKNAHHHTTSANPTAPCALLFTPTSPYTSDLKVAHSRYFVDLQGQARGVQGPTTASSRA